MASRSLTVIAKVRDAATAPLKKVQKSFRDTGKAVKKTGVDFTEFNRIMFSTTAFVGLFSNAFRKVSDTISEGANIDRLSTQFEKALGPKGKFFASIQGLTDNTIDRMEAMRAGIALKSLGISSNMGQIAEIVSMAGTAAKKAGLNSSEGIKKYTEFVKSGSISSLNFLNIIAQTNPELQAQMAILQKAGGPLGTVISTQQRLAIVATLLQKATKDSMKGQRDLVDILQDSGQAFKFLSAEIGKFLGFAFAPVIEKVTKAVYSFEEFIERIRTTDKHILQFTKNLTLAGTAMGSVLATLGTARLVFKALGALGLGGIPFIALSVTTLAASFTDMEASMQRITKAFKLFGAASLGIFQLIASHINDPENFAKGFGKMDQALFDLLNENGLIGLVTWLARAGVVAVEFGKGLGEGVVSVIDYVKTEFKGLIETIQDLLGLDSRPWAKGIKDSAKSIGKVVGQTALVLASAWGAMKIFSTTKSILSKIPFIGRLFGKSTADNAASSSLLDKRPLGTINDPLYVVVTGINFGNVKGASPFTPKLPGSSGPIIDVPSKPGSFGARIKDFIGGIFSGLGAMVGSVGLKFKDVLDKLKNFGTALVTSRLGLLGLAAAAGIGVGAGINALDKRYLGGAIGKGISGIIDYGASMFGMEGSSADQARMDQLQNTLAYKQITKAMLGAGVSLSPTNTAALTESFMKSTAAGSPIGAELSRITSSEFAKKLTDPTRLGVSEGAITNTPTMPTKEDFKRQQIQETMKLLDADAAGRMESIFKKALTDDKITREEWVQIFKAGMDSSKITENTEKGPPIPDHTNAKLKRGC